MSAAARGPLITLLALAIWGLNPSFLGAASWPWQRRDPPPETPHPAVVRVLAEESDGVAQGSGTLIDVREQYGLIITNWHVVRNASGAINVVFPDGFQSGARVVRSDKDWDLAVLLIWRPRVAPVPLANDAPRPGDPLVIAGYGSGAYRSAAGQCTQYLAPGVEHPFEIVEVSTSARQGDSGGPIFNSRRELAGVLFGSDGGSTSGSYAGRVRQFLEPVWGAAANPANGPPPTAQNNSNASLAGAASASGPSAQSARGLQRLPAVAQAGSRSGPPTAASLASQGAVSLAPLPNPSRPATETLNHDGSTIPLAPEASSTDGTVGAVTWEDFAGRTIDQQIKTVLAIIGLAAVFMQFSRFLQPQRKS